MYKLLSEVIVSFLSLQTKFLIDHEQGCIDFIKVLEGNAGVAQEKLLWCNTLFMPISERCEESATAVICVVNGVLLPKCF